VEQSTLVIRRYERVRKLVERYSPPNFHSAFVLSTTDDEPMSIRGAVNSTKGKHSKDVMVDEIESLCKNETRGLV
jgi:hypothetical protein